MDSRPDGLLDQWHQLYHREIIEPGDLISKDSTKWLVKYGFAESVHGFYSLTKHGRAMKSRLLSLFVIARIEPENQKD